MKTPSIIIEVPNMEHSLEVEPNTPNVLFFSLEAVNNIHHYSNLGGNSLSSGVVVGLFFASTRILSFSFNNIKLIL